MKEVPRKLVTVLAEVALPKCITPVKYVTKLKAIPSVINLSHVSTPAPTQIVQLHPLDRYHQIIVYYTEL